MDKCTQERFLEDIKNHYMKVLRDDGVNRHIRFTQGRFRYHFDLITWSEHLCISGDCGTYVFRRTEDMFDFFQMDKNDFNNNPDKEFNINKRNAN